MGVRKYPDVRRVYIDMDGPLADFVGASLAAGLDPKAFKSVAGAFVTLPLVHGAAEAIAEFESMGLLVFIMTKTPAVNPYAATEMLLWTRQHFPHLVDRVVITSDKGAVGTARDFLVDDHPEWANALNFPGKVLLFKDNWESIRAHVRSCVARATAA